MNNSPYPLPLILFSSPPPHPYLLSVMCVYVLVILNVFFICIVYVLPGLRLYHVLDLTLRLVLG